VWYFKNNFVGIAIVVFSVAIILAHIFSTSNYNWAKHTISHLGAQGYNQKLIMQLGFIAFGVLLAVGFFINSFSWRVAPMLVYAVCIAGTGIFCAKPFFEVQYFDTAQANIHSILAQMAGIGFTLSIIIELYFYTSTHQKWWHIAFLILVVVCSALFGILKNYQGIAQRLLYLVSFIWLLKFYKPYS